MKKSILTLSIAMFMGVSMLSACSSHEEKVENAKENVQAAKADVAVANEELAQAKKDSISDFQKFKNESNAAIEANDKRIAELRTEMKDEKKEAKANYDKKVNALEKKNHALKVKLDNYKDDGKSDWKIFKKEFKHDLDGLGKAFKDIGVRNT